MLTLHQFNNSSQTPVMNVRLRNQTPEMYNYSTKGTEARDSTILLKNFNKPDTNSSYVFDANKDLDADNE